MSRAAVVLALLLLGACRSEEERALERMQDNTDVYLDSLVERTRNRPPPPDTGMEFTIPRRDSAAP